MPGHLLAAAVRIAATRPGPAGAARHAAAPRARLQSVPRNRAGRGKGAGLPVDADVCRRVRDTPPQASLPFDERAKNVRRAFVCDVDLAGRRVAVVDDVLTTGASLNECAKALRKAGAAEVIGWVATRTLLET